MTKTEFQTTYEILGGKIKATPSGKNASFSWGASVTISCENVSERQDEKTNFINDISTDLDFKFKCSSDEEAGKLANYLKSKFQSKQPIYVQGNFYKTDNGSYVVSVSDDFKETLLSVDKEKSVKK
ncbi:Uncharacterised protein [Campylobacter sputorum subsp. bubulus]|uniref:hypothetical protein n=1 Tax=Campylobacter sputorum TaxID=206 RepID=UPI000B777380|nr:hypothetical protein [Campylobacter sputorum]ASM38857.1 hypothetical protein CSPARA_1310 [Campylobacter sputorum bv. paraureolyticus LMG 11764]SUX08348.1 Uncharacterised protein [Campylobacter sputorum subsp. bubulus]